MNVVDAGLQYYTNTENPAWGGITLMSRVTAGPYADLWVTNGFTTARAFWTWSGFPGTLATPTGLYPPILAPHFPFGLTVEPDH